MCFSASASFTASSLLAFLGILAIKKAGHNRSLCFFAATPFIFAIQQFCEGIVWISAASNPEGFVHQAATYAFLFFAHLLWPVWIPLVAIVLETKPWRKNICLASLVAGIFFSLYTLTQMIRYGVWSKIADCHIAYPGYGSGDTLSITAVLYLFAVVVPFFASSVKHTRILAAGVAGSLIFTVIVWQPAHVASIWCFFAAILSGLVLWIVDIHKTGIIRTK